MIKALNHVGISVWNLDRSIDFYHAGFGMDVIARREFESGTDGGNLEAILAVKGATGRAALLKGNHWQVELFEFRYPRARRPNRHRSVCDRGITHFCIEVADITGEYQRLKAIGAAFNCPPLIFFGDTMATYGRDPDGNVFELLEVKNSVRS